MYLHIGKDKLIFTENIIGIFDLDTSTVSDITKTYINNAQKDMRIVNVCDDIPKSFILCKENEKFIIYISQLASQTLKGRMRKNNFG
ncbi:MAG: DUF370 domain-containing protein [Clostridia bacterium]|nr:DUF370 domain-containing protein [Clostridia bacterium]